MHHWSTFHTKTKLRINLSTFCFFCLNILFSKNEFSSIINSVFFSSCLNKTSSCLIWDSIFWLNSLSDFVMKFMRLMHFWIESFLNSYQIEKQNIYHYFSFWKYYSICWLPCFLMNWILKKRWLSIFNGTTDLDEINFNHFHDFETISKCFQNDWIMYQ